VRAILWLVRGEIKPRVFRKLRKSLRRAARRLAASRDALVMLQAFEQLTRRISRRQFPAIRQALRKNHRQAAGWFRDAVASGLVQKNLRKIKRRTAALKLRSDGWQAIEPGLKMSFQRERLACAGVGNQPVPDNFHEWRKQVKMLSVQLRSLCPRWPAGAPAPLKELDQLSELLGEDHDLCLLNQWVSAHFAGGQVGEFGRLLAVRQQELRTLVLNLGARLHAESPADVCFQLGNYWNRWRGSSKEK